MIRRATENIYVQTAFHVAGGAGFGLWMAGYLGGARPWLAVMLMSVAVIGHIVAVTIAARVQQKEREKA